MQDSFLPGVTRRTVAEALERRFGASGGSTFRGRDLAGWYLQQARLPASSGLSAHRGPGIQSLMRCRAVVRHWPWLWQSMSSLGSSTLTTAALDG